MIYVVRNHGKAYKSKQSLILTEALQRKRLPSLRWECVGGELFRPINVLYASKNSIVHYMLYITATIEEQLQDILEKFKVLVD
jgi:hypothetical protein